MTTATPHNDLGWKIIFGGAGGDDPSHALRHHLLGGTLTTAINQPATVALDFYLPSHGSEATILDSNGLPPTELTVDDSPPSGGRRLFRGHLAHTSRNADSTGRTITLIYADPLHHQLAQAAPFSYPGGTVQTVFTHLLRNTELQLKVGAGLDIPLPAGGGTPTQLLTLLTKLAEERNGYLTFDPQLGCLTVHKWQPEDAIAIPQDRCLTAIQSFGDANAACSEVSIRARKRLQPEWFTAQADSRHNQVDLGGTGGGMRAWQSALPTSNREMLLGHELDNQQADSLAIDRVRRRTLQASGVTLTVFGSSWLAGDWVNLPNHPTCNGGTALITKATSDYRSATPLSQLEGVRS